MSALLLSERCKEGALTSIPSLLKLFLCLTDLTTDCLSIATWSTSCSSILHSADPNSIIPLVHSHDLFSYSLMKPDTDYS